MADNVNVTAGTGTVVAADEVTDGTLGTVKVQYVKLMDGTLDSTTKIGGSNGLPVTTIASTIPTATNMQTAAVAVGNGTNLNVQGYASAIISLTGTMGASTAVTFEASVDDTTFVSIAGHQIGLAGNLATTTTNTGDFRFNVAAYKSIRARVSVFGTGSVTAKGYASALAGHSTTVNANIIASLPTGTNAIGTLSDTAATGSITTQNLVPAGTATASSAVLSGSLNGMSGAAVQVTGTYTGALSAQATVDNAAWVTLGGTPFLNVNTGVYSATIPSASTGIYQLDVAAFKQMRITGLAAMTGTAVVSIQASNGAGMVALDAALPTGTNIIGALSANQSANVAQINGVTPLMGNGVTGTGALRVATTSDGTLGTVTTVGTVTTITNGVKITSATTGGYTPGKLISAATTNATSVKASAGTLGYLMASNVNAAARYLKIYNKASAPTVGTDTPIHTFLIPGNTAGAGTNIPLPPQGIALGTGIAFALTAAAADTDTTAVALSEVIVNYGWL